jgi:hypothetical protein
MTTGEPPLRPARPSEVASGISHLRVTGSRAPEGVVGGVAGLPACAIPEGARSLCGKLGRSTSGLIAGNPEAKH